MVSRNLIWSQGVSYGLRESSMVPGSLIESQCVLVSLNELQCLSFIHVINAVLTLSFCFGAPGLPTSLIVFGLGDTRGVVRKG